MKQQAGTGNRLLQSLPRETYERLTRTAELLTLRERDVLSGTTPGSAAAYFPLSGMVSMVSVLEDGAMVEAAVVGSEGMVGGSTLPREENSLQLIVQAPGEALRVPAPAYRDALLTDPALTLMQTRYNELLFRVVAQVSACNRVHSAHARLARWLLMAHDRVRASSFPMTQEFLAQMLGVRRPTVTVAAGSLHSLGGIDYRRGHVVVTDREALEAETCECYRTIGALYDRLFD